MSIKLRNYMSKDKMHLTRKDVRKLLYEIFNVSKNEQKILDEKRKVDDNNQNKTTPERKV